MNKSIKSVKKSDEVKEHKPEKEVRIKVKSIKNLIELTKDDVVDFYIKDGEFKETVRISYNEEIDMFYILWIKSELKEVCGKTTLKRTKVGPAIKKGKLFKV